MDNNLKIYNSDASLYAFKFNKFNRIKDIVKIFFLCKIDNPKVLELGCANGRDAKEILKRTDNYLGVDGAEKLLDIAKIENPNANFILSDFRDLKFDPNSFDIVIDFDSLFHFDKDDLKEMISHIYEWLNPGGLFMMDAKFGAYQKVVNHEQSDKIQYLYQPKDILELSEGKFELIHEEIIDRFDKKWFTIILKKDN